MKVPMGCWIEIVLKASVHIYILYHLITGFVKHLPLAPSIF